MAEIAALINRAYRNIGEVRGWTSEEAYVGGDRTTPAALRAEIAAKPGASLLTWQRDTGVIDGCVWLEPASKDRWYLGLLVVEPQTQNAGLGRRLLVAAEDWMAARGAREIELTVVNVRDTLLAWYVRRGYAATGEIRPWPYEDDRFGTPKRSDLHFVVLRKRLERGQS